MPIITSSLDQLAAIHDRLRRSRSRCRLDRLAQDVAGRDLRNARAARNRSACVPFPPRRPSMITFSAIGYARRPRIRVFFMNPS
jgi:hypothetical protein